MVSVGTKLNVSDNSGAIKVKCFKILGSSFCNHSHIGDTLVCSVKSSKVGKKVSKRQVHRCILIRKKGKTLRRSGIYLSFLKNNVVLVKKNNDPIGTRIKGSVLQELRYKKCLKIMMLSDNIV